MINCMCVETASISSLGCGGILKKAIYPQSVRELSEAVNTYREEKFIILGGLTNTVVLEDFDGIAVFSDLFRGVSVCGNFITAKAGEPLSHICGIAQYSGLGGMENLFGIPGTIGGAVSGNSGCFGTEIFDIVDSVKVFKLDTGETEELTRDEIAYGYRYCNLRKDKDFIVSVKLSLFPTNCMAVAQKMANARTLRRENQPGGKCLGSFFKQYNGISAGYFIEKSGLKGYNLNGIKVNEKHANFFINESGNAEDFVKLGEYVRKTVYEKTGVKLEREVNIIGKQGRKRDGDL